MTLRAGYKRYNGYNGYQVVERITHSHIDTVPQWRTTSQSLQSKHWGGERSDKMSLNWFSDIVVTWSLHCHRLAINNLNRWIERCWVHLYSQGHLIISNSFYCEQLLGTLSNKMIKYKITAGFLSQLCLPDDNQIKLFIFYNFSRCQVDNSIASEEYKNEGIVGKMICRQDFTEACIETLYF